MMRLALCLLATPAMADCTPPVFIGQPPAPPVLQEVDPPDLFRPVPPFCATDWDEKGHHSCEPWEVAAYREEIDRYVLRLNAYADGAREAAALAEDFADAARVYEERVEQFARRASAFIDCEIPDIRETGLREFGE